MTTSSRVRGNDPGEASRRVRENLRRLRSERGMTQAQLSEALAAVGRPIPVASIAKIEAGDRRVDVDDLDALAKALDAPVHQLLADPGATLYDSLVSRARSAQAEALAALSRMESAATDLAFFAEEHREDLTPLMQMVLKDWISMGPDRIAAAYREQSRNESAVELDRQRRAGHGIEPEQLLTGPYWEVWGKTWEFVDDEHSEAS